MTLEELDNHRFLVIQLNAAKSLLQSMRDSVLRASAPDGMPHGPGVRDKVSSLAIKIAEQEETVKRYSEQVKRSEPYIVAWILAISDNRTRLIFELRFTCGFEWKDVAETLGGGNTIASVKSQCYRYLNTH